MIKKATVARLAYVAVFVAALALVPAALAAKGGGAGTGGGKHGGGGTGGTSTLSGPVMVVDDNGDGLANRGDSVTFNVSSTATAYPEVGLRCYQGVNWVYDGYVGYWSGYMFDPWFVLDSGYWAAGQPASCDARLFYTDSRGRQVVLATLSFPVAP